MENTNQYKWTVSNGECTEGTMTVPYIGANYNLVIAHYLCLALDEIEKDPALYFISNATMAYRFEDGIWKMGLAWLWYHVDLQFWPKLRGLIIRIIHPTAVNGSKKPFQPQRYLPRTNQAPGQYLN